MCRRLTGRWRRRSVWIAILAASACATPNGGPGRFELRDEGEGPRVLCVVAHPDDEIAFAATVFKTATHLGGTCDIVVITDGSAGYKYSTLGALHYDVDLTDPEIGRRELPRIRQQEHLAGAGLLGFHAVHYLAQPDPRYTKDPAEVLEGGAWDVEKVERTLDRLLVTGAYDFVLTHVPSATTHGHHQAATILALRAIERLPRSDRPVALGAWPATRHGEKPPPVPRSDAYPVTRFRAGAPALRFDRSAKFGYRDQLDYQIVVNWAIAEHKSQGTFQSVVGRWDFEMFRVFDVSPGDASARAGALFDALATPQFEPLDYGEDGLRRPASRPRSRA